MEQDYQRIVAAREGAKTAKEAQKVEDELDEKEGMEEIQLTTVRMHFLYSVANICCVPCFELHSH